MLPQALRTPRTKHPGYTLLAILTLALGIGANTAIFTIVNALLLRPLPYYADPARLVLLSAPPADQPGARELLSWLHFTAITERTHSFTSVAAATFEVFNLTAARREPEQVPAARVSYQLFDTLGVPLALGRPSSSSPPALSEDLVHLYSNINAEHSDAALTWYLGFKEAILTLKEKPDRSPVTPESPRVRHLPYGNKPHIYRAIYRVLDEKKWLEVLHIRHGARRGFTTTDVK